MVTFTIRQADPPPLPQTRRPRTTPIDQIQWHATRGTSAHDLQVQATEGWFANPDNLKAPDGTFRDWGGSADFVVGPDRRIGGEIAIVQFGPWGETFSSWSAGYGNAGTLAAAEYGVAIEVAQSAALEPYDDATIEACAWLAGHINENLERLGQEPIPPVHIPRWDQSTGQPVPRGHIGHDELANGWKLAKSDPGRLFPWDDLMRRLQPAPVVDEYERGKQDGRLEMHDGMLRVAGEHRLQRLELEERQAAELAGLREAWGVRPG